MKHLFIINPEAGKRKAKGMVPEIMRILDEKQEEYFIEYTEYHGHATEIAKKYAKTEDFRIYSLGGDGTLSEVLNGIVGSGSSLAVIPAGSGNDFFRSISDNNTTDILRRTINGSEKVIDIGKVNEKYFLNISSVGFDAEIGHNADALKQKPLIPSNAVYILSIFTTILKNRTYDLKISIDGKSFSEKLLLAAISNARYYGGGVLPSPEAKIDDGLFDICTVKSLSKLKILRLFPKYIKGAHGILEEVSFYKCKKLEISCNEPIPLNIDGEISAAFSAVFEIVPSALSFVFPAPFSR
jgi:YegS/Rv2252/BmrU family lipid kinase